MRPEAAGGGCFGAPASALKLTPGMPLLTIQAVGGNAMVCWQDAPDLALTLVQSPVITLPLSQWMAVPGVQARSGGSVCMTVPIQSQSMFFRLRSP